MDWMRVEMDRMDGWMVDECRDSQVQVHIVWNPTEGQKGSTNQRKATNQRIPLGATDGFICRVKWPVTLLNLYSTRSPGA